MLSGGVWRMGRLGVRSLRSPRGGNTHGGWRAGGAQEKGGQQRPLDHVGRMYGTNAER